MAFPPYFNTYNLLFSLLSFCISCRGSDKSFKFNFYVLLHIAKQPELSFRLFIKKILLTNASFLVLSDACSASYRLNFFLSEWFALFFIQINFDHQLALNYLKNFITFYSEDSFDCLKIETASPLTSSISTKVIWTRTCRNPHSDLSIQYYCQQFQNWKDFRF